MPEFPDNTAGDYPLLFLAEVSQTESITMHALEFLRQTPADQPLYAQPHRPFCAPADYIRRVDPAILPALVSAE